MDDILHVDNMRSCVAYVHTVLSILEPCSACVARELRTGPRQSVAARSAASPESTGFRRRAV